jgi:rare lipoprotein A
MFHGRKTSSGDTYDMYAMTAAHPSLPIPSYVRVTNLANGRSAVVRVNDRGPFHPGRIIDLSYAAAYKLGYVDQGQANVEVALVLPEDVALVRPGRPVPPLRKARRAPAPVVLARQQPASSSPAVAALGEAPRPVAVSRLPA